MLSPELSPSSINEENSACKNPRLISPAAKKEFSNPGLSPFIVEVPY
jgi:hypothetical protein